MLRSILSLFQPSSDIVLFFSNSICLSRTCSSPSLYIVARSAAEDAHQSVERTPRFIAMAPYKACYIVAIFILAVVSPVLCVFSQPDCPDGICGYGTSRGTLSSHDGDVVSADHRKMEELATSQGYPLEKHFVTTKDGYVLGVYRIPHGRKCKVSEPGDGLQRADSNGRLPSPHRWRETFSVILQKFWIMVRKLFAWLVEAKGFAMGNHRQYECSWQNGMGPPVVLQHGLLDSSATWIVNTPGESLGFLLADAGFDVWMPNSRGTTFSRNHTGFDPSNPTFWDFSFSDMAEYDFPAVIRYVLQNNGKYDAVGYVGHSQGFTIALAALASKGSEFDYIRNHISLVVGLGPAAYVRYVQSIPLLLLAQLEADELFEFMGTHEFLPAFSRRTADLFGKFCYNTPSACLSVLTAICGYNSDNLNTTRIGTYISYAPSGTSVKNLAHWAQLVRDSRHGSEFFFRQFDYGSACMTATGKPKNCNKRVYGTETPPSYHIGRVQKVPLALFTGGQDKLADPDDVMAMLHDLPADMIVEHHYEPSYEHLDFTWGVNAARKVYWKALRLLQQSFDEGFFPDKDNNDLQHERL